MIKKALWIVGYTVVALTALPWAVTAVCAEIPVLEVLHQKDVDHIEKGDTTDDLESEMFKSPQLQGMDTRQQNLVTVESVPEDNRATQEAIPVFQSQPQSGRDTEEFEEYLVGVLAAEMPALYPLDALKAQAVASRTYAYRALGMDTSQINPNQLGQAYIDEQGRKEKWGANVEKYEAKIRRAVEETKGVIMVQDEEPILAVFHAVSRGKTESAENIWQNESPALKMVDSNFDENAPGYLTTITMSAAEAAGKLQNAFPTLTLTSAPFVEQIQVVSRTDAGYIKEIQIGNLSLTGRQVREILGLRSADFTITQQNDQLTITTKGYGHGAGMSQFGAGYLAKEGKTWKEILSYYYQNISLEKIQ